MNTRQNRAGSFNYVSALIAALRCYGKARRSPSLTGIGGGTFDPPTFWDEVEREIFCRSRAEFINTDVKDKFKSGPVYQPVNDEEPLLKGG